MAIALDTSVNGGSAAATSLTWSHTCTGTNLVLFVSTYVEITTISGVTYGGVSMTQVGTLQQGGAIKEYLFALFNPSTGAHNIVVSSNGNNTIGGLSASYTGVFQGGIDSNNGLNNSSSTSISVSTTTVTDNCWLVCGGFSGAGVASAGANTTLRQADSTGDHGFIGDSNAPQTPAGSKSQTITCASGTNAMIVASIAPFDTNPRYWVGGSATWDNTTKANWSNSSGGASGATPPLAGNNAVIDANSGASTVTIGAADVCNSLTCTGFTGTLAGSNTLTISGSLTLASGMTLSYSGAVTFNATSSQTITTGSKTILSTLTFNGVGGTWTLQDTFTTNAAMTLTNGSLALNGQTVTGTTISNAGTLTTGNGALAFTTFTNSGTASLGTNTITISGTGTVWNNTGTVNASTSTIKITDASSSAKTFTGGGSTYYNLWITGSGTGAYTINGSNTFNNFKIDTPPHTVNFQAGSTQTLNTAPIMSGTAGNLMTLQSTSAGTQWMMRKTIPGIVSLDYLSLQDSNVETP